MRTMLATLAAAVLALTLVPGAASAQIAGDSAYCAPAGPPAQPGNCSFADGFITFDFEASSGPLGENATGSAAWQSIFGTFANFQVTCLQVTGNQASFGGPITDTNSAPPGSGAAFTVVDNGGSGPDLISGGTFFFPASLVTELPNCGSGSPADNPVQGDIVVKDCVRFKDKAGTDKDKCKPKG